MQELKTTATLVDDATFEGGAVTAVLSRGELQGMLGAASPGLWFELGFEDDEVNRLTIELEPADIEEMLRVADGDEVVLALDAGAISGLLEVPDVEAHGMRSAIAIAVAVGAVMAPAGLAATPQASTPAAKSQVARSAVSSQVSRPGVESQIVRTGATAQVTRAVQSQVSKSLIVRASGVHVLKLSR